MKVRALIKDNLEDSQAVFKLVEKMVAESSYPHATPDFKKVDEILNCFSSHTFLAITENDEVVGFITLSIGNFFWSNVVRIFDLGLFILPEHRGGATAIHLLERAQEWAKKMKFDTLYIGQTVGHKVEETKNFYERLGFVIDGFNAHKKLIN